MASIVNESSEIKSYTQGELLLRAICMNANGWNITISIQTNGTAYTETYSSLKSTSALTTINNYVILPSLALSNISNISLKYTITDTLSYNSAYTTLATLQANTFSYYGGSVNVQSDLTLDTSISKLNGSTTGNITINNPSNTALTLSGITLRAQYDSPSTNQRHQPVSNGSITCKIQINSITLTDGTIITPSNAGNL